MAITVTEIARIGLEAWHSLLIAEITLDSSYPTGGETVTAANVNMTSLKYVFCGNTDGGYVAAWDDTNKKIQMFEAGADGAALDEVTNATDLSAEKVPVIVIGRA